MVAKAQAAGELPFYYGPGVMFLYHESEVYIHGIRVPANPTDAADLSRAEMQGRADAWAMFQAWRREVPGFEQSYFIEAYPWIGVRESRRIIGQHVLSEDDLMQSRRFDDAIATAKQHLLVQFAVLPLLMAIGFGILAFYFKSKGGYKPVDLSASSH